MFSVATLIYVYLLAGRRLPKSAFALAGAALLLIVLTTVALGRSSDQVAINAELATRSTVALGEFRTRALFDQQEAAVYGFRYIYGRETQNGREWIASFSGVLPGSRGSDLANRIYDSMFGTIRGTAPPSLWGSAYYNFGPFGIAVLPALLATLFARISRAGLVVKERNTLELMGIAGTFATIGFWAADTPLYLLNAGLAVYVWMWWWGSRLSDKNHGSGDPVRKESIEEDQRQT